MMFPKTRRKKNDLDAKLWKIFSEYIRRRDADSNGLCKCITCGKTGHWKMFDAGHFVSRDSKATKFSEKNVAAQCPCCNCFHTGKQFEFGQALDRKYGKGTAEQLMFLSKVPYTKLDDFWYQEMIKIYKIKLKSIKEGVLF